MEKNKVTHLTLGDLERRAAGIRAAQLGVSITTYVSSLIQIDAERAGIVELVKQGKGEVNHG